MRVRDGTGLNVTGDIIASGSCCGSSDGRLKTCTGRLEGGLELVERLRPVRFRWKTEEFPDRGFSDGPQIGFIAQEVLKVLPELVTQDDEGYYAMDYGRLTAVLTAAVQELHGLARDHAQRLEQARQRIEQLEHDNRELRQTNETLKQRLDDQQAQLNALRGELAELRSLMTERVRPATDVPRRARPD